MSYHLLLSQLLLHKHVISLIDTWGLQWAADKGKAERSSAPQDTWMMMGFGFCWSQTTGDFPKPEYQCNVVLSHSDAQRTIFLAE